MGAMMMDDRALAENGVARVEVVPGVGATEYRITGALPDVFEAISAVFTTWPPQGYGTMVHALAMAGGGSYVARMSRSNSCD